MEFNHRGRLVRVVDCRVDRIRVPAVGEQALRIHSLDKHLQLDVLIAGRRDMTFDSLARSEGAVELHFEPGPNSWALVIARHTRARGARRVMAFSIRSVVALCNFMVAS